MKASELERQRMFKDWEKLSGNIKTNEIEKIEQLLEIKKTQRQLRVVK